MVTAQRGQEKPGAQKPLRKFLSLWQVAEVIYTEEFLRDSNSARQTYKYWTELPCSVFSFPIQSDRIGTIVLLPLPKHCLTPPLVPFSLSYDNNESLRMWLLSKHHFCDRKRVICTFMETLALITGGNGWISFMFISQDFKLLVSVARDDLTFWGHRGFLPAPRTPCERRWKRSSAKTIWETLFLI